MATLPQVCYAIQYSRDCCKSLEKIPKGKVIKIYLEHALTLALFVFYGVIPHAYEI